MRLLIASLAASLTAAFATPASAQDATSSPTTPAPATSAPAATPTPATKPKVGTAAYCNTLKSSTAKSSCLKRVHAQASSTAKTPAEYQSIYNNLAKSNFDAFVAESKKIQDLANTIVTTSFAPINARVQALSSLFKAA